MPGSSSTKKRVKFALASNACRLRWCPICSQARYNFIRSQVRDYVLSIRSPKFLTLTVRHTSTPLSDQVEALYRHFRLFRQHKFISRLIRGGCWFFQIKRSSASKDWHPHLHCLIDADYIDKRALSEEWRLTTGDSFIVDIRSVKEPQKVADYVSRYCSKPCNLSGFSPEDQTTVFDVLHGRRLCGSFGSGRTISFRPRNTEDRAEWFRCPRWIDILANRGTDRTAKIIWKAYTTGQPVGAADLIEIISPPEDVWKIPAITWEQLEIEQNFMKGWT